MHVHHIKIYHTIDATKQCAVISVHAFVFDVKENENQTRHTGQETKIKGDDGNSKKVTNEKWKKHSQSQIKTQPEITSKSKIGEGNKCKECTSLQSH